MKNEKISSEERLRSFLNHALDLSFVRAKAENDQVRAILIFISQIDSVARRLETCQQVEACLGYRQFFNMISSETFD